MPLPVTLPADDTGQVRPKRHLVGATVQVHLQSRVASALVAPLAGNTDRDQLRNRFTLNQTAMTWMKQMMMR